MLSESLDYNSKDYCNETPPYLAVYSSPFVSSAFISFSSYIMFMLLIPLNIDIVGLDPGEIIAGKFGW